MDEKWSWKPYISNLLKKLGHRLCLTESFICLIIRRIAYFNGLVLPQLDYGDVV